MARKIFCAKFDFFSGENMLKITPFLSENERFYVLISRNTTKQCAPNSRNLVYSVCRVTCVSLDNKKNFTFDSETSENCCDDYMDK